MCAVILAIGFCSEFLSEWTESSSKPDPCSAENEGIQLFIDMKDTQTALPDLRLDLTDTLQVPPPGTSLSSGRHVIAIHMPHRSCYIPLFITASLVRATFQNLEHPHLSGDDISRYWHFKGYNPSLAWFRDSMYVALRFSSYHCSRFTGDISSVTVLCSSPVGAPLCNHSGADVLPQWAGPPEGYCTWRQNNGTLAGVEDVRLFARTSVNELWSTGAYYTNSTCLTKVVIFRYFPSPTVYIPIIDERPRGTNTYEKNWIYVSDVGSEMGLMQVPEPLVTVKVDPQTGRVTDRFWQGRSPLFADEIFTTLDLRGSTNFVPFPFAGLSSESTTATILGTCHIRVKQNDWSYVQTFVILDSTWPYRIVARSFLFVVSEKEGGLIPWSRDEERSEGLFQYLSGLAYTDQSKSSFVLTYGEKDCAAKSLTVKVEDVRQMIQFRI